MLNSLNIPSDQWPLLLSIRVTAPVARRLYGTILLAGTPFPVPPASARRQRTAPFTTLTPIALENFGGLIRGLGLYEEIYFCLTIARIRYFLTKAPQNHDSRVSPTLSLRPEQHSKDVSVAAMKNTVLATSVNGTKVGRA